MIGKRVGIDLPRVTLTVCLAAALTAPAIAGDAPRSDQESIDRGRISFRTYCSNCHGDGGRGGGKMADLLKVPPADLSRLSERHEGSFPADLVYRAIDGRDEIRGHGRSEMPVWGIGFRDPGRDSDQAEEVRQRILDLVSFIGSIQEPDGDGNGEDDQPPATR